MAKSFFSGGSYNPRAGVTFIGKTFDPDESCIPDIYSKPPSFHSPDEFTNTDQIFTLLCRRLQSLFKNESARYKNIYTLL